MLVVYPVIYHGFYTSQVIFSPYFWITKSMPSTMAVFFRAQKSHSQPPSGMYKTLVNNGISTTNQPQLVNSFYRISAIINVVCFLSPNRKLEHLEIPNMKLTLTERPRMAHTKTTSESPKPGDLRGIQWISKGFFLLKVEAKTASTWTKSSRCLDLFWLAWSFFTNKNTGFGRFFWRRQLLYLRFLPRKCTTWYDSPWSLPSVTMSSLIESNCNL